MFIPNNELIYEIYDEEIPSDNCGMSRTDIAFLCGLLKKYKPSKIVEVGVAAGATTKIILKAIQKFNLKCHLYSVDLNTFFYRDIKKHIENPRKTCFECGPIQPENHSLYTGKYLPDFLPLIGDNIDFCILDTVHALPGELLDWLAIFPYLSINACVVLHDVHLYFSCRASAYHKNAFCNHVVLDSVVAKKYLCKDINNKNILSNIAAFVTDKNTFEYIENSFISFSMPWFYLPDDSELKIYEEWYKNFYSNEMLEYYNLAIKENKLILKT